MKRSNYLSIGALTTLLGLMGCVDDNYKINDANNLSRISINDLTIPLNLEKIYLDSIVDLTDGTNVEIMKDSKGNEYYALVEKGTVESSEISIDPINVEHPTINQTSVNVSMAGRTSAGKKMAEGQGVRFDMERMEADFAYYSNDVDESVISISALETAKPAKIIMTLSLPSSLPITKTSVSDMRLEFPKGMKIGDKPATANIGTYDDMSGIVTIPSYDFTNPHQLEVVVTCDNFDFTEADAKIDSNRRFTFAGTMGVAKNGYMNLVPSAGGQIPSSFELKANYDLASFSVRNFTGDLDYKVDDTKIDPIHLDDLPDFLQDPETKLFMADPRFYFSIENPTAKYGTQGSGQVEMKSSFGENRDFNSESPEFLIPAETKSTICLSPTGKVEDNPEGFTQNLHQYAYPEMKYILSGNPDSDSAGLPSEINVAFENARFFGHATKFPVTVSNENTEPVGSIKGEYDFIAPLGFDKGSIIVYSETADIGGDEMEHVFVEYLTVKANGDSSFPVDVRLSAIAYDSENNKLGSSNSLEIPALSQTPIELKINAETEDGVMRNIDHLDFIAKIVQEEKGAGTSLAPNQGLELSNLKITVSGYYEKKF